MKKISDNKTALITGASAGFGKFIALECAKSGFNLVLASLPGTGLKRTARILEDVHKVKVYVIETDLSTESGIQEIRSYCVNNKIVISLLVNNAGIGFEQSFNTLTPEFCSKLIDLNIKSIVMLTRLFLDDLLSNPRSYILNMSSLASFAAMPYKSLYAASKSFIRSFSVALNTECSGNGLSVTALCPGPISTNDLMRKRIRSHGFLSCAATYDMSCLASLAVKKTLKGDPVVVPGILNQLNRFLMFLVPERIQQPILNKLYRKKFELLRDPGTERLNAA
jgi:short-subunit dehydrogenase